MSDTPLQPEDPFPHGRRPAQDSELGEIDALLAQASLLADEVVSHVGDAVEEQPAAGEVPESATSDSSGDSGADVIRNAEESADQPRAGSDAAIPDDSVDTVRKVESTLDDAQRLTLAVVREVGDREPGDASVEKAPPAGSASATPAPSDVEAALAAMESLVSDLGGGAAPGKQEQIDQQAGGNAPPTGTTGQADPVDAAGAVEADSTPPAAKASSVYGDIELGTESAPSLDEDDDTPEAASGEDRRDTQVADAGAPDGDLAVVDEEISANRKKRESGEGDAPPAPRARALSEKIVWAVPDGFVAFLTLLDRPFAGMSPTAKQLIGYAALGTLFMAVTTWLLALFVF